MDIEVIYKDNDLLVVNKPAGLLTHPIKVSSSQPPIKQKTLADWLINNYPEIKAVGDDPETRPGIVHRLDKDTSGVLLVARNQKTFDYLKNLFQTGQVKKTYLALVWGKVQPKSGQIKKPIGLKSGSIKRTTWLNKAKMVKEAVTEYKVKNYFRNFSLLEVWPLTGRTHQIRIHLNSIGYPVAGDLLYGKKPMPPKLKRQFLHAESAEFNLPDGGRLKIAADLPPDLKSFLESIEPEDR